jgi:hypothetical protein
MAYKKGPVGYMKSSTENKAVGYMAVGSVAHMHGAPHTSPTDGKKEYDKKEQGNVLRNVVDSLQTVEKEGELAAAKKYGNFTREIAEGGGPSIYRGTTSSRSISTPDTGNLDTNKSLYGKGLPTDGSESTSTTKIYKKQQEEMAKRQPGVFPTRSDAKRGTYQGYRS